MFVLLILTALEEDRDVDVDVRDYLYNGKKLPLNKCVLPLRIF